MKLIFSILSTFVTLIAFSQLPTGYIKENYQKKETYITTKDGIKLFTVIYTPKDQKDKYPIILERTPYSCGPYGDTNFPKRLGPNPSLAKEKYIFVYQDVRGRYMSEGQSIEMTPYKPNKKKGEFDENSDTYETIEWLLRNIPNNNGKVGITGVSYPGFFTSISLPNAHPAIKAASPQAPMTDEFAGDDAFHNGAFFLMDNFNFINYFGKERNGPVKDYGGTIFPNTIKDAYRFFDELGPLKNTNQSRFFNNQCELWNEMLIHNTYDEYWKIRNVSQHLKNINIPTLAVGGWFDAEDLYGSLKTYQALQSHSNNSQTKLVMGPWTHGGWKAPEWKFYATHDFGSNTSVTFQDSIETQFFNYYLKNKGTFNIAAATIFETGSNQWTSYASWPPQNTQNDTLFLNGAGQLISQSHSSETAYDEYTSDPNKPVPYTAGVYASRNIDFMAEDQRFAANRPDVLVFETPILSKDLTVTGPITANLQVSLTGSDADFVVKVIDVLPEDEPNFRNAPKGFQMSGYQRMVRAEIMRGKFRNSLETPQPFEPNKIERVKFQLNDIAHCFKKGHKIMIQIQSSWFPLVDKNPQQFMNISDCNKEDFKKINIKIWHDQNHPSYIILPVLLK